MKKIVAIIVFMFLFVLPVRAENINVAFTIDNNYPIFTMLVINSILRNNTSNSDYTFYVIENNLTAKNKLKMQKYVNKRNQTVEFINVDTSIIDEGNWFFWFSNRITSIAMARILIPDILPKQVQKVIYMDADTLVLSDLKDLYDIDLDGKAFGMIENITQSDRNIAKYYNSGVILMDLNKCRAENSTLKMLNFVKKHIKEFTHEEGGNSGFFYPDQDLINIVMEDEIKELPLKWNNQYIKNFSVEEAYDQGIVHYIGEEKPWTFSGRKNDFIKIYFDYWNKSGLRRYKVYYGLIALYSDYKDIFQSKIAKIKRLINHNENVDIF